MDDKTREGLKAFITMIATVLLAFVPKFGPLLDVPILGWVLGMILSWAAGRITERIDRGIRIGKIEKERAKDVAEAQKATEEYRNAGPEDKASKRAAMLDALRRLTKPNLMR